MVDKNILDEYRDLYEQFSYIIKHVYETGYKDTILKLFSLIEVKPDVNIYQINCILVEANIGNNTIKKNISYDNISDDFSDLSDEIIYNYYLNKTNSSISMDNLIHALKDEVNA